MARCRNRGTRWRDATSSSGQHSTITLRNRRPECHTQGSHPTTDWGIINRWNKMATDQIAHLRWVIWDPKQTATALMGTSLLLRQFTRRASFKRQQPRRVECPVVPPWSRRSRCRTICTLSNTWPSTECRRTSSTSCTQWTTCSTRRRCLLCISSRCTHSKRLLNNLRQTPTRRCPVRSILGCEVNSVSYDI